MQLAYHTRLAGDYDEAERLLQESYTLYEKIGMRGFQNVCRSGMADVARMKGDLPRAGRLYQESIKFSVTNGNHGAVARCLECLAFIAIAQGVLGQAATLFGAAESIRETSHSPMLPFEQDEYEAQVAELKRLLEPQELESAWKAGRALDQNRAVAFAATLTAGEAAGTAH